MFDRTTAIAFAAFLYRSDLAFGVLNENNKIEEFLPMSELLKIADDFVRYAEEDSGFDFVPTSKFFKRRVAK